MIGSFIQRLQQGVAPDRSMMNGGGGSGSSGTPYYAQQDKLFGTQADIAQGLYNQYASLAPGYLQNTLDMTDQAMSGQLHARARNQAGADASQAFSQNMDAVNRNMAKYGSEFNANRTQSMGNQAAVQGMLGKSNAMNQANAWAEDQKWNRNAGAYGQIAGMGTGAMQGMGSAAAGYGGMAASTGANNAANAAGMGKFGAGIASGMMFKADGGYIEKRGLKLAEGAYVRGTQKVLKPAGYQQQVLNFPQVDWRNRQVSYGGEESGGNAFGQIAAGAAPMILGYLAKEYGKPYLDKGMASVKEAWNRPPESQPQQESQPVMSSTDESWNNMSNSYVDWDAQSVADNSWFDSDSGGSSAPVEMMYYANGGYVPKRGLHLYEGGGVGPYDHIEEESYADAYGRRLENSAASTAQNPMTYVNAYNKYTNLTGAEDAAANNGNGATVNAPVTGAESASTVDGAANTTDLFDGAGTAADASAAADAGSAAEGAAGGIGGSVPYGSIVKGVVDIASGRDAGEAVADAAMGYAGAEAGATIGSAVGPVGTVVGGLVGGLLGGSLFNKGGAVKKRGLKLAGGGAADPYAHVDEGRSWEYGLGKAAERGPGADVAQLFGGSYNSGDMNTMQQVASHSGSPGGVMLFKANGGDVQRRDFRPGGKVQGPGTETSDDIPAWLSDGEFVLNSEAVKIVGKEKLEKVNKAGLNVRKGKEKPAQAKKSAKGLKLARGGSVKRKGG